VEEAAQALHHDPSALRALAGRPRAEEKPEAKSRDGAVLGRLAKIHRKRHWLVNAQSYVAAFPATGGGLTLAVVLAGLCRKLVAVKTAAELEAALAADARFDLQRRITPFEADASTILAHWIRRPLADEQIVAVDVDLDDLAESFTMVRDELAPLVL
jgi:hypothetical protein